ncbi:MAG: F0F1 ATP synthase subunit C [Thermotogae bacterium]|nr:F0F1 ATP synthase subunit C [Thermotogota bacterium]
MKRLLATFFSITLLLMFSVGFLMAAEAGASKGWAAYIGSGLAVGFSALATGYAQAKIGAAGAGALAEDKSLQIPILLLLALPETIVIVGFVAALFILR